MYGQIGSWEEGLAIAMDAGSLKWLDTQGTDRGVCVSVLPDRAVAIKPQQHKRFTNARKIAARGRGAAVDYQDGASFPWEIVNGGSLSLPRFELYEVKFDLVEGALYASLPADHLLPWPKLRDCAAYDRPTKIVQELERRMCSARDASLGLSPAKWSWVPMPEAFRNELARGVYADCLRAVIDRRPYAKQAEAA
jgi:hypothetical protein